MKQLYRILALILLSSVGIAGQAALPGMQGQKDSTVLLPGNKNIQYFGRWDKTDPARFTSYWGGAYFKVRFTGSHIKIKLGHKSNYFVKIDDGPWLSYKEVQGIIDLTPAGLSAKGLHTISVAQGKDYDYIFDFQGILLDPGARLVKPVKSNTLIEWIGDSITAGYTDPQANVSDYAWVCSEMLHAEHTQIAYPGIDLVSGYHGQGMDVQYKKERSFKFAAGKDWKMKSYKPDLIVINIGTNDVNNHVPPAVFQKSYEDFLCYLRKQYPKADIFVMQAFAGSMSAGSMAAVKSRNRSGDHKIHFITTKGWLQKGKADYTDNIHPSASGHIKVARRLVPLLSPYIKK